MSVPPNVLQIGDHFEIVSSVLYRKIALGLGRGRLVNSKANQPTEETGIALQSTNECGGGF
jgi:hypothetical protein